ncbi:MAG: hypothetical protein L6R39_004399 [Caloplaca ligustica]|nr:MAG: hypothetical protein L6R39_004399 [Caloplaca ligustica]
MVREKSTSTSEGLVLCTLPEWKEDVTEDTRAAKPKAADRETLKWAILRRLGWKKKGQGQERGFSVRRRDPAQNGRSLREKGSAEERGAVPTPDQGPGQDSVPGQRRVVPTQMIPARDWIPFVVKAKVLSDSTTYAVACLSAPPTAKYREFISESFKALRRQSQDPREFPTRILVNHMLADWHKSRWSRRFLPEKLDENNFQGCLLKYSRCMEEEPVEIDPPAPVMRYKPPLTLSITRQI